MSTRTVGIIGAGHVGCALAFDLSSRGYEVILRTMPGHPGITSKIRENGNVIECSGVLSGRVPVRIEEDVSVASNLETFLVVCVPSQGHDAVLEELAQHDLSGCIVIFISGNAVSVKARRVLRARAVLESSSSPYSSRVNSEGTVAIRGIKSRLQLGPMAAADGDEDRNEVGNLFHLPIEWSQTGLDIFLSAVNGVVHVPTALLNLGWIETTNGDFYFYRQGMSAGVCSIIEAADRERLAVAAAYRCPVQSALDVYNKNYGRQDQTMREFALNTDAHNRTKGAQKRFLSQDVPYWLVLCADLGARAGVPTPVTDMLILLASIFSGTDLRATGRTLESLGLRDASMEDVVRAFRAPRGEDGAARVTAKAQLLGFSWIRRGLLF
ncbi:NAD/NADP octopine/nopaline dehydrogenase, alpha-helical domain-containing protein [Hirsutella rhossiliensis]|uniref:NAD/NADP octopine/nopaline dehydrogenase, alpha-helical domain-containing protein n=1 Tax=Hirsutella rhossiliensis TaxID=111463 RepID=A0A9P8MXT2_9HYPO|nr:NAD/NADP octopine/nopaline dehydrogenase, alpha-helical domain-containing protein [Hirsutella rhossiliensis]KAH0962947.1 NAD/NADP octopine/nopaline dehydrogenase, alpha-helical domain-containing protein [Hirsutella rhossiliensis]